MEFDYNVNGLSRKDLLSKAVTCFGKDVVNADFPKPINGRAIDYLRVLDETYARKSGRQTISERLLKMIEETFEGGQKNG